ncbi:MAG: hypothetical protein OZSIB_2719 [Candidatus Ozemobacter sibiricus]|jgi:hypothetical protein|uniref:Uncharacterized protein n=1 Tax=Candidatus Ozemobacter sibiricus TaxID=2268124 RepID=A0A367ZU24_9BACT|nr:MAG: hypothetical protein OZSIB_2719 [Candidatus Ozemobacter sibiricus]
MNTRQRVLVTLLLGAALTVGWPTLADPVAEYLVLDAAWRATCPESPAFIKLEATERALATHLLDHPADLARLLETGLDLSPDLRQRLLQRLRFAIAQDGRTDLLPLLARLETAPSRPATAGLSTDHLLGIPMRPGKLELTALFQKRYGQILRIDRQAFHAVLDTYRLEVTPHPSGQPGRILATISGGSSDDQLPQEPVAGTLTTDGTVADVVMDDGTTLKVTWLGNGKYIFQSSLLPVKVTARYID